MSDAFTIATPPARCIAAIATFRNHGAMRAALSAEFGIAAPTTPSFIQLGTIALSCLSPTRYVATAPRDDQLPARLTRTLAGLAAVTDQSDLWHVFAVTGPAVCEHLTRLVPVDLTEERFPIGALALTRAGHLDVRLWHLAPQSYEIATPRSYAADLLHALEGTRSASRDSHLS